MNHDAKLIAVYDKLEEKLRKLKEELASVEKQQGPQGEQGLQGPKGEQGDRGRDGVDGKDGRDGSDGAKGRDGEDGISITNVSVDFDNHLRVDLSDGNTIDAGAIDVEGVGQGRTTQVTYTGGGHSDGEHHVFIQENCPNTSEPNLWIKTCSDGKVHLLLKRR